MRNVPPSMRQRRQCLQALAGLAGWAALAPWSGVCAAAPGAGQKRVVVLDWGLTEIVLSLGVTPVGVARPAWYRQLDGQPPLPAAVVDTGLLYQPNFEVVAALRPDLILVNPMHAPLLPWLERIAPVFTAQLYQPDKPVYPQTRQVTLQLAALLHRQRAAEGLLQELDQTLASCAKQAGAGRRPCYILKPIDGRYVMVYGASSLFGGVWERLGGSNAWSGGVDFQGAAETDVAALAAVPQAALILLEEAAGLLPLRQQNPLWRALPAVQAGRVYPLGKLYPQGGLATALRFAKALAQAIGGEA